MNERPHMHGKAFLQAVENAVTFGEESGTKITVADFNVAFDHVLQLLRDATDAFDRMSKGTAVFLAVTALEETAKAELLIFRKPKAATGGRRGRDPLRDHRQKHLIAVRPTTFMGRLPRLLGEATCARLQAEAESGAFGALREEALYFGFGPTGVQSPAVVITFDRAREVLLLALEAADDALVGYSDHSMEYGGEFAALIDRVAALRSAYGSSSPTKVSS